MYVQMTRNIGLISIQLYGTNTMTVSKRPKISLQKSRLTIQLFFMIKTSWLLSGNSKLGRLVNLRLQVIKGFLLLTATVKRFFFRDESLTRMLTFGIVLDEPTIVVCHSNKGPLLSESYAIECAINQPQERRIKDTVRSSYLARTLTITHVDKVEQSSVLTPFNRI